MSATLKHSKQREFLSELLKNTKCHPDANWIFMEMKKRFKNVSLATVYRNLKLLLESGKIIKIDVGSGTEHYDMTTEQHYHFVCEKCSDIADIDLPVMERIDKDLSERIDADINKHSLIFYGTCKNCRRESAPLAQNK